MRASDFSAEGRPPRSRRSGRAFRAGKTPGRRRLRHDWNWDSLRPGDFVTVNSRSAFPQDEKKGRGPAGRHSLSEALRCTLAGLLAAAILLTQFLHGGLLSEYLALPGLILISLCAVLALPLAVRPETGRRPSAVALLLATVFAAWVAGVLLFGGGEFSSRLATREMLGFACIYLLFMGPLSRTRHTLFFWTILFLGLLPSLGAVLVQVLHRDPGPFNGFLSAELARLYGERLPPGAYWHRATAFFINGNHLAWILNCTTLVALSLAALGTFRPWKRYILLYFSVAALVAGLFSLSRGGFLGLVCGLTVLLLVGGRSAYSAQKSARLRRFLLAGVCVSAAILAGATAIFFSPLLQERLSMAFNDSFRPALWSASLQLIASAPLTGHGPDSYASLILPLLTGWQTSVPLFAHNDWIQLAAEFGVPALQLAVCAVAVHLATAAAVLLWNLPRRAAAFFPAHRGSDSYALRLGILAACVACVVHSYFDFNMHLPSNAWLALACLGALGSRTVRHRASLLTGIFSTCLLQRTVILGAAGAGAVLLISLVVDAEGIIGTERLHRAIHEQNFGMAERLARTLGPSFPHNPKIQRLAGEAILSSALAYTDPQARHLAAAPALPFLKRAAELAPSNAWNHLWLGIALDQNGRHDLAEEAFHQAARLAPGYPQVHEQLGWHYEVTGNRGLALEAYEKIHAAPGARFAGQRLKALQNARPGATHD